MLLFQNSLFQKIFQEHKRFGSRGYQQRTKVVASKERVKEPCPSLWFTQLYWIPHRGNMLVYAGISRYSSSFYHVSLTLFNPLKTHTPKRVLLQTMRVYRPLVKNVYKKKSYFSTKTYVVGTQKNRLSEMVLLSTQNICSI